MATQNVTINTGEGSGFIQSLATHIFENHGREIGDAIIGKNFGLSFMKDKAESIEVGGLDFAEPVMISENSNFAFQSKYSQIAANIQDPFREFKFDPVALTGTIALNDVHVMQNEGKAQIKNWMESLKKHAQSTVNNVVNRALWAATPTANVEPESFRSLISTTPTTGTIGTISRVGNTWAQNGLYSTAITTIGGAAGLAAVHTFIAKLGGAAGDAPDFGLTTATIWGNLMGYLDNLRRATMNEKMAKLGFPNLYVGTVNLGYDGDGGTGQCPASSMYIFNSNHIFFKVLKGGYFVFEPFSKKDNSLNSTSIFKLVYNLTTNLPSSLGVLSNITG